MPFHLRAEYELGLRLRNRRLDLEIVVGDERLEAQIPCHGSHVTRAFAAVGTQPDHFESELFVRDPRSRESVCTVREHEDAFPREVVRVDRARIPGQARVCADVRRIRGHARKLRDLRYELARGAYPDRYGACPGLSELSFQPARRRLGDLRIEHDVEVRVSQSRNVFRPCAKRRDHGDVDAKLFQEPLNLAHIVAIAEPE